MNEIAMGINIKEKSGIISFSVDNEPVTVYIYKEDLITMNERKKNTYNSIDSYIDGLNELTRWMFKLKILNPMIDKSTEYELHIKYDDNVIYYKYYLNQRDSRNIEDKKNILMNASYDINSKLITFFPRPEIKINFSDLKLAIIHAKYFTEQIKFITNNK